VRRSRTGKAEPGPSLDVVVAQPARWADLLGIAWVLAVGVAVLVPALAHGAYLGPFDILSKIGLTAKPSTSIHNPSLRDQIASFIPFTQEAWTQVHQGHLPLWNPYSGLGGPLAFRWESAPFGLPALIGYLAPMRYAYTVGMLVTLCVAGTGGYVFGRVLRLGVLASAFLGTVFVLSGAMVAELGWPATAVGSWAGWLFAAAVLVIRGRRRVLAIGFFAVALAMSIYAGHPETELLLLLSLAVFVVVVLIQRIPRLGAPGPIGRPTIDLVVGGLAGAALAAPLLLPGLQAIEQSGRSSTGNYDNLTTPDHGVLQLLFQGFDGLPVAGSHWFGHLSYQWTAAYVGVIVLVLAVLAVGVRWRRPEVLGSVAVIVVMAILVLVPGVPALINGLPLFGSVILTRALIPLGFGLAVLGAFGLEALMQDHATRRVRQITLGGFAAFALVLVVVWFVGRGHLPPDEARIRTTSFLWPAISIVIGLAPLGGLFLMVRRNGGAPHVRAAQITAGLLLVAETAFLVTAGTPLWTSNTQPLAPTPAVATLNKTVGSSLVGLGSSQCIASTYFGTSQLGILPETNIVFGVHELAIFDPLAPSGYYSEWHKLTGVAGGNPYYYQFCPAVTSVAVAQRFGVGYVLEAQHVKGPAGSVFVKAVGDEDLYRIPHAAAAILVAAPSPHVLPPDSAIGTPVAVHDPDPATLRLTTDAATAQVLRLHLTDVPGWHASLDGRPLALERYSGVMLQARIPPGRHVIVVRYWPTSLTIGFILAGCAVVGLAAAVLFDVAFRRRRNSRTIGDSGA
jgi:hypothetical protein